MCSAGVQTWISSDDDTGIIFFQRYWVTSHVRADTALDSFFICEGIHLTFSANHDLFLTVAVFHPAEV